MTIPSIIIRMVCGVSTRLLGHKGTEDHFSIGQRTIQLLDEAFDKPSGNWTYEEHILEGLDRWLGTFDEDKYTVFSNFINQKYHVFIPINDLMDCPSIFSLGNLLNERTGYFFPDLCEYCVDKHKNGCIIK